MDQSWPKEKPKQNSKNSLNSKWSEDEEMRCWLSSPARTRKLIWCAQTWFMFDVWKALGGVVEEGGGGVKNMNLSSPFTSTVQSGCSQFKPLSCPGIDHWQKRNPSDGILTSNMSIRTQHHRTINAASWTLQSSAANSCRWQDLVGAWLINPGFNSLMLS